MKKYLGLLLAFVMIFALSARVNAKTLSCGQVLDGATALAQQEHSDYSFDTSESSGSNLIINITAGGSNYKAKFTCSNGIVEYNINDENNSMAGYEAAKALVVYVARQQGKTAIVDWNTFDNYIEGLSSFTYCENNISGTYSGDINTLKIDASKFGTNTCGSNDSGSSSSSSSSSSSTTNKTTETNPKTGVFVPIVGISVLIVASVVCLLWISKKNIYKGF